MLRITPLRNLYTKTSITSLALVILFFLYNAIILLSPFVWYHAASGFLLLSMSLVLTKHAIISWSAVYTFNIEGGSLIWTTNSMISKSRIDIDIKNIKKFDLISNTDAGFHMELKVSKPRRHFNRKTYKLGGFISEADSREISQLLETALVEQDAAPNLRPR